MSAPRFQVQVKDAIDDATMRRMIRVAFPRLVARGIYPSHKALSRAGVRGAHERIGQVRDAMIDEGLLAISANVQVQSGTRRPLRPDHPRKPKPPEGNTREARLIRRVLARRGGGA